MKRTIQTDVQIEALIAVGQPLTIVSGEGVLGTVEPYRGAMTVRAIKARLTRERCFDRWARVDTVDGRALCGVGS